MLPLPRVRMLVDTCSIEAGKSELVGTEMRGNPVEDNTDTVLVKLVHEVHEVGGLSVSGCGRIVARHLVSPGSVKRMLRYTDELDVSIFHLGQVLYYPVGKLPVGVKTVFCPVRMFHPGTDVALVDGNGHLVHVLAL